MALVLAVNAGSSSLKASILRGDKHVANFLGDKLGTTDATLSFKVQGKDDWTKEEENMDQESALKHIVDCLQNTTNLMEDLVAVGHRVVHGGESFTESVLIDDNVIREIEKVSSLAPLHNPHNLNGIKLLQKALPDLPAVAVFDTSYHSTLPPKAFMYPLPSEYRDAGIRKYGFHGTSVRFVVEKATAVLRKTKIKDSYNMIVCHLGNGASITAVANGQSVETSMGFSPLAGLMMGTRAGSVDPSIVSYAVHHLNKSVDDVISDMNKESGLKAMVNDHNYDMRSLLRKESGDKSAALAVDMFIYRIAQYIAMSVVALPGPVDALIFTAGIGEHSSEIRRRTVVQLSNVVQLELDSARNENGGEKSNGVLSKEGTWPVCLDVKTDEEIEIAHECMKILHDKNIFSAETRNLVGEQLKQTIQVNK